jgi:hypothetical protein
MYRPQEAYLEEHNPGDKAMTRNLVVTVFAMSLTLVGCGSSSTTKPDAAPDVKAPADVAGAEAAKLDTPPTQPDARPADSAQPDVAIPVDTVVTPDAPVIDAGVDVGAGDVGILPDTRPVDARPADAAPDISTIKLDALDAPAVDAPDAGDGAVIDGGILDGGDAGQDG